MPITEPTTTVDAAALREHLEGTLHLPGEDGWDEARRAWNLAVDQRPAAVVVAHTVADVASTVRWAAAQGLRVTAQGTGHGATPIANQVHDAVLIRTHRLRGVEVEADIGRVCVQAGATWGDVAGPVAEHGFAALAGSSHDVGVVGYALGGGVSWLARKHGLAANSITAIQVVTAGGRLAMVDEHHEPDLFWALRGGGGSFGIVTAIEMQLVEVETVYAGMLAWPIEQASDVLHAWHAWTATTPDEVTSVGRLVRIPPLPDVPEMLRGRALVVVETAYLGSEADGAALLAPLRALTPEIDTFAVVAPPALLQLHMDPPEPVPAVGDGMMLDATTPATIDAFVAAAGPDSDCPLVSVELRQLGGALRREGTGHGVVATLDGEFALYGVGVTPTPEAKTVIGGAVTALKAAMEPWAATVGFFNFSEAEGDASHFFSPEAYRRLRAVKSMVDPEDRFRGNHSVAPLA